jgi:hypothetical protein
MKLAPFHRSIKIEKGGENSSVIDESSPIKSEVFRNFFIKLYLYRIDLSVLTDGDLTNKQVHHPFPLLNPSMTLYKHF